MQAICPAAKEFDNSHVPKDLELLPDLVANMAVIWMKPRELVFQDVGLRQ
jgi:hypothetical protein